MAAFVYDDTSDFIANIKICLSVEIDFWNAPLRITYKNIRSVFKAKYSWRVSILVKVLSFRLTVILLMILKLMVLRNFIVILSALTGNFFFLVTLFLLTFSFNLLYWIIIILLFCYSILLLDIFYYFLISVKTTKNFDNQRIKLYKIRLNYTVCKDFKNYRIQNMCRFWSSILI